MLVLQGGHRVSSTAEAAAAAPLRFPPVSSYTHEGEAEDNLACSHSQQLCLDLR